MTVRLASAAFLLDIVHIAIRGELAVTTDDAATAKRRETEESNKTTHTSLRAALEQLPCR
jgi:hypothetical protein